MGKLGSNPLAGLAALGLGGLATPANTGGLNPAGKSIHVFKEIVGWQSYPIDVVLCLAKNYVEEINRLVLSLYFHCGIY